MRQRSFFALILCLSLLCSCEKDDICPQSTLKTPDALVAFYTLTDGQSSQTAMQNIKIYGLKDKQRLKQIPLNQDSKSASLPLDFEVEQSDFLILYGRPEPLDSLADTLKIAYKPELTFISKACGFKFVYREVEVSSTTESIIETTNELDKEPYNKSLLSSKITAANIYFKTNP